MNRRLVAALLLVALSAVASPLAAQIIDGRIQQDDGVTAASGVVLVVARVRDSAVVARTVTGERGTFRVSVPTDSVTVTALRIGYLPALLATVQVKSGEVRTVRRTLPYSPAVVEAIRTRADDRCQVRPNGARLVATLFSQARTALLASQLVSDDGVPSSRYRMRAEFRNRSEQVERLEYEDRVSVASQLFRSLSADSLAQIGYATREADGDVVYRAPDAGVLVDDQFLAGHCLMLEPQHPDNPDWIGVRFRPIDVARDRVEVEGVLWMDRQSSELRRLEYEYVGVSRMSARATPGGWVNYTRLPSGTWLVHEWEIRMPRVASVVRQRLQVNGAFGTEPTGREQHLGAYLTGGELLELSVDGRPRYATGRTSRAVAVATGAGPIASLEPSTESASGACGTSRSEEESGELISGSVPGRIRGVVRNAGGTPRPSVLVTAQWGDSALVTGQTDAAGGYTLCDVPTGVLIQLRVMAETRQLALVAVRLAPDEPFGVIPITVSERDSP